MPNLARHHLLKLLSLSTSTYGPSPSTTIRLFNIYIRTLLEYGSAVTCADNPSRFIQWERLQMWLITKTLDLPNMLNHDILRRHADQPTIHDILLYLAKRWYNKAYENNAVQCDFIHKHTLYFAGESRRIPHEILKLLAATLTNYEMKKNEKIKKVNQLKTKTSFKKNKRYSLTKRNSKKYILK